MDFVRRVSTTTAKGKKRVGITPSSEREMGLYGTLHQRSRRYFWHSWYFWDARCAAWPPVLPLLLLPIALFLLGLHCRRFVAGICDCGTMKSVVFGLEGPGAISVGAEGETRGLSRGNVPHLESAVPTGCAPNRPSESNGADAVAAWSGQYSLLT
jgi:hypothetical protein